MKTKRDQPTGAVEGRRAINDTSCETLSRREFITVSAVNGAKIMTGKLSAATMETSVKMTFTILHTDDMHSALIGMGPASDYSPFTLNDDSTRGGYARLASLIDHLRAGCA
jgi:5'-nucleotidase / UDP-sugar diphosphatase